MKLAVFFPGIGYHVDKPLLYHSRKLAAENGYEKQICVNYTGFESDIKGNKEKMEKAFYHALEQAKNILSEVQWEEYEEILFVSKSIGTIVAAAFAKEKNISCKNIFYTPLEHTFMFAPKNGIAFSGSKDNWVHPENIIEGCDKIKMPLYVIEGTNHSLELGDTIKDLENLKYIMEITKENL